MSALVSGNGIQTKLLWAAIVALGTVFFGIVALRRGESVNAAWLVIAAVCIYFVAYRFYALFVANRALGVDAKRQTPAYRRNDGLDYVPTNRYVLYGHHFAAMAGAAGTRVLRFMIQDLVGNVIPARGIDEARAVDAGPCTLGKARTQRCANGDQREVPDL